MSWFRLIKERLIVEGCWVFSSMTILLHKTLQVMQKARFVSEGALDQSEMKKLGLNLGKPQADRTRTNMGCLLRMPMEEDMNQRTH